MAGGIGAVAMIRNMPVVQRRTEPSGRHIELSLLRNCFTEHGFHTIVDGTADTPVRKGQLSAIRQPDLCGIAVPEDDAISLLC